MSIWTYQGPGSARAAKERVKAASEQFQPSGRIWLPILALYTPVHLFAFVVVSSFLLLPVRFAAAFWVGSLVVYYAVTSQGNPSHTGGVRCVTLFNRLEEGTAQQRFDQWLATDMKRA